MLYKVKNMHNKKCLPAYILLFLLLIILSGCGCNVETVDEHNSKIEREALERSSALESLLNRTDAAEVSTTALDFETAISDTRTDTKTTGNTDDMTSSKQTDADSQTTALLPTGSASSETKTEAASPEADTAAADNTTSGTTTANKEQTTQSETTQVQTTAPYIKVHITITCSKVIENHNLSTDAKLPKDGIMLDTYVAVRNGDSAFDALKAAADDNGISLSYTKSSGSVYVGGINGLNEKQCGRYSGWRYSVNNVYPNVGCGGYTLSDGDSILFGYVATYTDSY